MKIDSSSIQLTGQHVAAEKHTLHETLKVWVGDRRPDFEGRGRADSVSISPQAQAAMQAEAANSSSQVDPQKELENDPRYQLIVLMIEALTGQKMHLIKLEDFQPEASPAPPSRPDPNQASAQPPTPAGYGVEYDRHETHHEIEHTSFSAQGTVNTADGKKIEFRIELAMNREYSEQTDVSIRLGDAKAKMKDPLVINFSGSAAQLTDAKFSFDLDADGKAELVSFVTQNSGFLALDSNGNGKVDSGSELFGPATGNGFSELAAYDLDENGWIDENDAVFQKLSIWSKDAAGKDSLSTLLQKNIGAVYLGSVATPFDLKDSQNRLDGQVRSSGVYLNEDGGGGTMQQIDLAV